MGGYFHSRLRKKCIKEIFTSTSQIPQHSLHDWNKPAYGQKVQYTTTHDTSTLLDKNGIKKVQQISGTFLYYGLAIDPTILPALNEIATQQSAPTENTLKK